ncbi:hypothetical protein GCM10009844_34770 [Nocardioides koreensis]|uniref:Uncharacterized protein n=1 Tax=Nocardioides koreensis TaxID=433651 RepID=A0ABN3A1D0_9ACTN
MLEVDAMGQPVVVEDLDPDWLLAVLEEKKHQWLARSTGASCG